MSAIQKVIDNLDAYSQEAKFTHHWTTPASELVGKLRDDRTLTHARLITMLQEMITVKATTSNLFTEFLALFHEKPRPAREMDGFIKQIVPLVNCVLTDGHHIKEEAIRDTGNVTGQAVVTYLTTLLQEDQHRLEAAAAAAAAAAAVEANQDLSPVYETKEDEAPVTPSPRPRIKPPKPSYEELAQLIMAGRVTVKSNFISRKFNQISGLLSSRGAQALKEMRVKTPVVSAGAGASPTPVLSRRTRRRHALTPAQAAKVHELYVNRRQARRNSMVARSAGAGAGESQAVSVVSEDVQRLAEQVDCHNYAKTVFASVMMNSGSSEKSVLAYLQSNESPVASA